MVNEICGAPGMRETGGMVACPFPALHDGPHSWQRPVPPPAMAPDNVGDETLAAIWQAWWDDAPRTWEELAGDLSSYIDRLHGLVRWFDLAYGDNEPTWLFENTYGQPLPANVEMSETYRGVIGNKGTRPSPA